MNALTYNIIAGLLVASVLFGLRLMNKVPTAVKGNLFCASAMGLAILVTMFKDGSMTSPTLWLAIAVGMTLGLTRHRRRRRCHCELSCTDGHGRALGL